jgi:hypothetical protein
MNPVDLIKRNLGPTEWERCRQAWAEDSIIKLLQHVPLFREWKFYLVRGQTGQFDFPMLPHGSYGFYAATAQKHFG